jgi:predicted DNA-binding protein with PD1-like motif
MRRTRLRSIKQPGRPARPRILSVPARSAGEWRVVIPEGADLLGGLIAALRRAGVVSAAVSLAGGRFRRMQYLTGQPCNDGTRVATYGAPTVLEGPVGLISGNAFLGLDQNGLPIVHCHAVMIDREGRVHGGHLPPGACIVGAGGVIAHVAAIADAALSVRHDDETNFPVFHPTTLDALTGMRAGAA